MDAAARQGRCMSSEHSSVITRAQVARSRLGAVRADNRLRYGRWQRLQRGVYAPFTGEPTREERIWAALLRAGPGATLSHWTAAERHGLTDRVSPKIHTSRCLQTATRSNQARSRVW